MKKQTAIDLAKSSKALAEILGINPSAVSLWGEDIPAGRVWQLKCVKPEWFPSIPNASRQPELKEGVAA